MHFISKKYSLSICLAILAVHVFALETNNLSSDPVVRDNQVMFYYGDGVSSMSFDYDYNRDKHDIDPNQPFQEKIGIDPDTSTRLLIHVYAGRHGSTSVADSWNYYLDKVNMLGYDSPGPPSALNFWLEGTLSINGNNILNSFYLGQGHDILDNPWWVGNTSKEREVIGVSTYLVLPDINNKNYCLTPRGSFDSSNVFTVSDCSTIPDQ